MINKLTPTQSFNFIWSLMQLFSLFCFVSFSHTGIQIINFQLNEKHLFLICGFRLNKFKISTNRFNLIPIAFIFKYIPYRVLLMIFKLIINIIWSVYRSIFFHINSNTKIIPDFYKISPLYLVTKKKSEIFFVCKINLH